MKNVKLPPESRYETAKQTTGSQRTTPWRFRLIMLTIVFVLGLSSFHLIQAKQRQAHYQTELQKAKQQYQEVQTELGKQLTEQERLNDPAYLEELARKDYFYSKDGEILFRLESDQ